MEAVVLDRIRELLVYRHWSRLHPNLLTGHSGQQIRREYVVELRALVKLARAARRLERSRPDPLTAAKAEGWLNYHDHQARGPVTEDDLLAGYGLDPEGASDAINREGLPEFNGAFGRW